MPSLKVAAVVHLFYEEQWRELARYLGNILQEFVLYVTIPDFSDADREVLRDFPAAHVIRVPNIGRDVAPFIALLPALQSVDLVCKVHTKRTIANSDLWRRELLRGVLGSQTLVRTILEAFEAEPDMVLVGSRSLFLDGPRHDVGTRALMAKYFGALPARYGFFGGTMFWVRPALLADFPAIFPLSDFVQHDDPDCHVEHAVERLIGVRAVMTAGAKVGLVKRGGWMGARKIEIRTATVRGRPSLGRSLKRLRRSEWLAGRLLALRGRQSRPDSQI